MCVNITISYFYAEMTLLELQAQFDIFVYIEYT